MSIGTVKRIDVYDECFPGRFLKSGLLKDRPVTLEIKDVHLETLPDEKSVEKDRAILSFAQTPMQMPINRTNGICLKGMFGPKIKSWIGKRITLVPEMAKFGSENVSAIRISGSPDITEVIEVEIRMPKRKPQIRRLVPTGKSQQNQTQSQPDPAQIVNNDPVISAEEAAQIQAEEKQQEEEVK